MNAVELFAGAGGLSVGLERVGFKVVMANEIEPDFARTLAMNHPDTRVICGDIHDIDFEKELGGLRVGKMDLVSGGPPCQGFSTVGSKNAKDERNSLFYEFLRAVRVIRPDYVLFENVSGFKHLYQGTAYDRLLRELDHLGYATTAGILEASGFGLPQRRQRTIVVGWLRHLRPVKMPESTHWDPPAPLWGLPKLTLMDAISDLPPLTAGGSSDRYRCAPENDFQRMMRGGESVLTEHHVANYGERMREILSLIPPGGSVNDLPERLRPESYFGNTYARLLPDQPSPTITRNFGTPSSSRCVHPFQDRALSTREGARLQGFPDSYRFHGAKGSKNLQIGNAVPPVFGEIIARMIVESRDSSAARRRKAAIISHGTAH